MCSIYHHSIIKLLLIFSILITGLFAQERQKFDPHRETKLRFRFNFSDPATTLGAIMTTSDTRVNDTFFFNDTESTKTPRFLSVVKVLAENTTNGLATIRNLSLPDPETNVSVHYFRMSVDPVSNYTISGSRTVKTADFPLVGQEFERITVSPSMLPDMTEYLTLIYSSLIQHDSTVALSCQYSIDYTGIIRSIYFNDDPKGQWGVEQDDIKSRQTYTSGPVKFRPNEMLLLTLIGYRLNLIDFQILNCQNDDGFPPQDVNVTITQYKQGNRITVPQGITYTSQTSYCQSSAARCFDTSETTSCLLDFFRDDYRCRGICPANESTITSYNDCTTFSYTQIRRGYKSISERNVGGNTEFSYYVDLPAGSSVLTVFWPSESPVITPTTVWFSPSPYLMSKAVYTTHNLSDSCIIEYSVPLRLLRNNQLPANSQRQVYYSHHEMITDPERTLMTVSYLTEPQTDDDRKNPRSFTYAPHNRLLQLNPQTFIYITTFLDCRQPCTISVLGTGNIEGFQDSRTFLFAMDYGDEPWTYTLPNSFTGVFSLTFTARNSSDFSLKVVSRDYTIFSHGFPLTMQTLSLSQDVIGTIDSTSLACVNGENNTCFSCNRGYFLNMENQQCLDVCPGGSLTYIPDRKCFRSKCHEQTVEIENAFCNPKCDVESMFYIEGQGCRGECFKGCPLCSNSTGVCVVCAYKDPVSFLSECSHCPPGTMFNDQNRACTSSSGLAIMGPTQISSRSDLVLTASMNPVEELYLTPITFTWTVDTSSISVDIQQLRDFLKDQTNKELIVPTELLVESTAYTFTVRYSNVFGEVITASITTSVLSNPSPPLSIDGGSNQVFYYFEDVILKARVAYSQDGFALTEALQAAWSQTGGPQIDFNPDSARMPSPFWLFIPKCTLQPGNTYAFEVGVWKEAFPGQRASARTEFRVPPVNFTVDIINGNREVPSNFNIDLQASVNYKTGDCPPIQDNSRITYLYTCEKKNQLDLDIAYEVCQDPKRIFNTAKTDPLIKIPIDYFAESDTLRIGVTATRGAYAASTWIVLNVTGANSLLVALACSNCKLGSYPQDMIFTGNVANNSFTGTLSYEWSVSPRLLATSFQNTYKVTRGSRLDQRDFMRVQLLAQSSSQTGKSYLQIPVDPAPRGGVLTVSPDIGYSLSRYFHISADNWQDEDAPLSYEFFYTFGNGPEFRLSDKQRFPYLYTMLPASAATSRMTIRVSVRDSLGADSSAQSVIAVVSRGENIMDALRTMRTTFGDITKRGDLSVIKAEPLETLKTLAFMGREMSTFENLNASYADGFLTPAQHNQVIGFKMAMIDNMRIAHSTIPNQDTDEILMQAINTMSFNTVFNVPSSMMLLIRTMASNLGGSDILSSTEMTDTSQIITNMLASFATGVYSEDDAQELRDFTETWLYKLISSAQNNRITGEAPLVIQSRNFDVYIARTTGCSMITQPIKTSESSPQFNFNVLENSQDDPSLGCGKVYNLAYFAFNQNASSAQNATSLIDAQKSMIAFAITDLDNNAVSLPLTYVLTGTNYCPEECARREDQACRCPDSQTFKIGYVLDRLFGLISKRFYVWFTVPFWTIIASAAWLFLTLIIVGCIMPKYCKLANFKAKVHKTRLGAFSTAYWITHKFFNIYTYYDSDLPKTRRAAIYFLRIQLFSVLACLIALSSKYTAIEDILLQPFKSTLPVFIVVFLIPYATIYPIHTLLEYFFRSYNKNSIKNEPDGSQRSQELAYDQVSQQSQPKNSKCLFVFGVLISVALFAGSQVYTWITGVKQISVEERNAWATYLAFLLALDIVVTPLVFLLVNYIVSAIFTTKLVQQSPFLRGLLEPFADSKMIALKSESYQKKLKVNPKKKKSNSKDSVKVEKIEGKAEDRQIALGDALPEYYSNVHQLGTREKEVGRANPGKFGAKVDAEALSDIDARLGDIPFSRQQSTDSLLNNNLFRFHSGTKNNDPTYQEYSTRQTGPPTLFKLDSRYSHQDPRAVPSLEYLSVQDAEDEELRLIRSRSSIPGPNYEKPPLQIIRGPDGSVALRESQISTKVDNLMLNVDGENKTPQSLSRQDSIQQAKYSKVPNQDLLSYEAQKGYVQTRGQDPRFIREGSYDPRYIEGQNYRGTERGLNNKDLEYYEDAVNNSRNERLGYGQNPSRMPQSIDPNRYLAQGDDGRYYKASSIISNDLDNRYPEEVARDQYGNVIKITQGMNPQQIQEYLNTSKDASSRLNKQPSTFAKALDQYDADYAGDVQSRNLKQLPPRNNLNAGDPRVYQDPLNYPNGVDLHYDPRYGDGVNNSISMDPRYLREQGIERSRGTNIPRGIDSQQLEVSRTNSNNGQSRVYKQINHNNRYDPTYNQEDANNISNTMDSRYRKETPNNYRNLAAEQGVDPLLIEDAENMSMNLNRRIQGGDANWYEHNGPDDPKKRDNLYKEGMDSNTKRPGVTLAQAGQASLGAANKVNQNLPSIGRNSKNVNSRFDRDVSEEGSMAEQAYKNFEESNDDQSYSNNNQTLNSRNIRQIQALSTPISNKVNRQETARVNVKQNFKNPLDPLAQKEIEQAETANVQESVDPRFKKETFPSNKDNLNQSTEAMDTRPEGLFKDLQEGSIVMQVCPHCRRASIDASRDIDQDLKAHPNLLNNVDSHQKDFPEEPAKANIQVIDTKQLEEALNASRGPAQRIQRERSYDSLNDRKSLNASMNREAQDKRFFTPNRIRPGQPFGGNVNVLQDTASQNNKNLENTPKELNSRYYQDSLPQIRNRGQDSPAFDQSKKDITNYEQKIMKNHQDSMTKQPYEHVPSMQERPGIYYDGDTPKNSIPRAINFDQRGSDHNTGNFKNFNQESTRVQPKDMMLPVNLSNMPNISGPSTNQNNKNIQLNSDDGDMNLNEYTQKVIPGKDETWYDANHQELKKRTRDPEVVLRTENRENSIRRPTIPIVGTSSQEQDVGEFESIINPNLHRDESLRKASVGRRGANIRRFTRDPPRNMRVQTDETGEFSKLVPRQPALKRLNSFEENKTMHGNEPDDREHNLIKVKPSLSRTLSYPDNDWTEVNYERSEEPLEKSRRGNKRSKSIAKTKSRIENYIADSPVRQTSGMVRSHSYMGPKLKLTSLGSKTFEIKLGKEPQTNKNKKCNHHNVD